MKLRKLISVFAIVSLLMLSLSMTTIMVGAHQPEGMPAKGAAQETTPTETATATTVETPTEVVTATVETPTEVVTATVETPTETATPTPTVEITATEVTPTEMPVPTETPTVAPTDTLTPTVEPTVELTPTATVTPTSEAVQGQGDIGAQGDPGSWTTTYIGIQNLENASSNAVLTLYSGGSSTVINKTVYPLGVVHVTSSEFSDGRYAGVIESNTQLAAGVMNVNTMAAADAYAGENHPGTKFTLPLIFRLYSGGWSSTLHVQNAGGSNGLTVYINLYVAGQTTPAVATTRSINTNESVSVDLSTSEFSAFGSNYGYAVITSTQNIATVNENFRNASGLYQATFYTGVPDSSAGMQLSAPLVFNEYSGGWSTGIQVVNVGGAPTTVVMTYTTSGGVPYVRSQGFAAGESKAFYLPAQSLPANTYGSVAIGSSSTNVVALANAAKYVGGSVGYAPIMLNSTVATRKVAVPLVFNGDSNSSWISGIQAVNLDTTSRVITATFVRAGVDPSIAGNTFVRTSTAPPNGGSATFYMPSQGIGNFAGAVFVESEGPVMALGSNTFYPRDYAANLNGISY